MLLLPLLLDRPGVQAGQPEPAQTLTVFAAASLSAAFHDLTASFQREHPNVRVQLNFAGSSTLVQQILEGAPADVFASADEENMQRLTGRDEVAGSPVFFARNKLEIVVARGNPKHVTSLADLAQPGLTIVLCGAAVPAGHYAIEAFRKAHLAVPASSQELNVTAVLTKIALGEADAGIVYATDVRTASDTVEGVAIPEEYNVTARYPIAILKAAPNPQAARALVDLVLSSAGQKALAQFGFLGR